MPLNPIQNVYTIPTAADLPDVLSRFVIYNLLYDPGVTGAGLYGCNDGVTLQKVLQSGSDVFVAVPDRFLILEGTTAKFDFDHSDNRFWIHDANKLRLSDLEDEDFTSIGQEDTILVINNETAGDILQVREANVAKFEIDHTADRVSLFAGYDLRIHDAGNTDYIDVSVDTVNRGHLNGTNVDFLEVNVPIQKASSEVKHKDGNTASVTTTLADDPDLSGWALLPASYYMMEGWIKIDADSGIPDLKWRFNWDNAPAASGCSWHSQGTGGTMEAQDAGVMSTQFVTPAASGDRFMTIHGFIDTHASLTTTVDFQFAQNTSDAGDITLWSGSWIKFTRVGDS